MAMFGLYIWTTRTYVPNTSRDPEAIPYGKHLSFMYAFSLIVRQADSILVFNVLGAAALAVYTIATAIPERLSGFFRFLFIAALPQFSNRTKKSIRDSILPKALKVTIAGLVLTLIYVIAAPYLFAVFFPRYMESLAYSQLYALIMIAAAGNLSVSALLSQRLKGELYFFNIALPLLQIILLVALIFPFGMVGVLVARIIGTVCETLVSLMFLFWSPFKDRNTTA
jgi:O-antigen/teichoic acid export membrane protein